VSGIVLSVRCRNWRVADADAVEGDGEFKRLRPVVQERDKHTCKFCGFKSSSYQEIHHIDGDHANHVKDNLATICMFCHGCFHLNRAGRDGEASLIWMPEISQERLNHILRSLFAADRWADQVIKEKRAGPGTGAVLLDSAKKFGEGSRSLIAALQRRDIDAERRIGTADPAELANMLLDMDEETYARRGEFLAGIRLMHLGKRMKDGENVMPKILDSWLGPGGPYGNLKPTSWSGMLKTVLRR
jgi:intracellular multiplication protein IcmJ